MSQARTTSQTMQTMALYLPLPSGVASPVLWGTAERLRELFDVAANRDQTKRGGRDADR